MIRASPETSRRRSRRAKEKMLSNFHVYSRKEKKITDDANVEL
jgi:hypothetical protein